MMQPPDFWWRDPSKADWRASALAPAAKIWEWATARRIRRAVPQGVGVPVICVGNLTVGGTGKTPMVRALLQRLRELGQTPHVLSRGYGGRLRGPRRVDTRQDSYRDVGDEPLMLAADGPVWIARDRVAGAHAAVADGASVIVMDDGYQNPGLAKDLSLLVVDAERAFGNGRVLPAGPLREPVEVGLRRAHAVVAVGGAKDRARLTDAWPALSALPIIAAELQPEAPDTPLAGLPVIGFAGIGRPENFFATLRGLGANLVETRAFPDHHPFRDSEVESLLDLAAAHHAQLVTTEKDAVRVAPKHQSRIRVVKVQLRLAEGSALDPLVNRLW